MKKTTKPEYLSGDFFQNLNLCKYRGFILTFINWESFKKMPSKLIKTEELLYGISYN